MPYQNVSLYPIIHPPQRTFLQCTAPIRNIGGSKGGGKSHACRMEITRQSLGAPYVRGLVLRRRYREVINNTLEPLQKDLRQANIAFGTGVRNFKNTFFNYRMQDHIMQWYQGSTTQFGYCKNMKDVEQYQGIEYDFICVEELQQWTFEEISALLSCLRSSNPRIVPNFFGSCNPGGRGHNWIKRLFIKREFEEGENPDDYAFIPSRIWDNPTLLANDPNYLKRLQALPEKMRRAYLEGDWDVFDGQYFPEFRRQKHVIAPFIPIEGVRRRIVALDYGYSAPSAVYWMAQMENGQVIVYRELYVTKYLYGKLAATIRAMTTAQEQIHAYFVDPSIVKKKDSSSGRTAKQDFSRYGIPIKPAVNDRLDGWQTVRGYLEDSRLGSGIIAPRLQITSNCHKLIETLPEMLYDDVNVEDMNTDLEDHACDALRYGLQALGKVTSTLRDVENMNSLFTKQSSNTMEASRSTRSGILLPPTTDDRKTFLNTQF